MSEEEIKQACLFEQAFIKDPALKIKDYVTQVIAKTGEFESIAAGVYAQDLVQVAEYWKVLAGLRYDVDPKAALKVELNSTRKEDIGPGISDKFPELRFQYAIRF